MMITERDSTNFSLAPIAKSFFAKGHMVEIFSPFINNQVLRMFDSSIKIHSVDKLAENSVANYDLIFASPFGRALMRQHGVFDVKKYIFSFDFLLHAQIVNGSDFCFRPSHPLDSPYEKCLPYGKFAIGDPKFDVQSSASNDVASNKLLFIDSGHYPFGKKAKNELARVLLNICHTFPDHKLTIKPRFLPEDSVVTHQNDEHLYDNIEQLSGGVIPSNMILLRRHIDLQEVISQNSVVICLPTTAYIGALIAGKNLLVLDGLPSEDCYSPRNFVFEKLMKGIAGTGAVVDYRSVLNWLPAGIKPEPDHLKTHMYSCGNVANNIVEVVEFIYEEMLSKEMYPPPLQYEFSNYQRQFFGSEPQPFEAVLSQRIESYVLYSSLINFDYFIDCDVDPSHLIRRLDLEKKDNYFLPQQIDKLLKIASDFVSDAVIKNAEKLKKSYVDCGILIKNLFRLGKYNEILEITWADCNTLNYFKGEIFFLKKQYKKSIDMFELFLDISLNRRFTKELTDTDQSRVNSYYRMGISYENLGEIYRSIENYKKCFHLSGENHRYAKDALQRLSNLIK